MKFNAPNHFKEIDVNATAIRRRNTLAKLLPYINGTATKNFSYDGIIEDLDLEGIDLQRANLKGAYIQNCNLRGANLAGANLSTTVLRSVNLEGANLTNATLTTVDFDSNSTSLFSTNLCGANLQYTLVSDLWKGFPIIVGNILITEIYEDLLWDSGEYYIKKWIVITDKNRDLLEGLYL